MRFIVRTDASKIIGAGHVMRSCAIAEELISRGEEVIFVGETKDLPWVQQRVNDWGFSKIYDLESDFTPNPHSDVLILDSYSLDPESQFVNQKNWRNVVALVDAVTPKYRANLYIHPGTDITWQPPVLANEYAYISGVEFIPIRKSIRALSTLQPTGRNDTPSVLVTGGGSDPHNFCAALGEILQGLPNEFHATFISEKWPGLRSDHRFSFVPIGSTIEDFLAKANLVFTTAGTSSWEFLACGLPLGIAQGFENQSSNYLFQTQAEIALGVGAWNDSHGWSLRVDTIQKLISDPATRVELSNRVRNIVDGKGAERIAVAILGVSST